MRQSMIVFGATAAALLLSGCVYNEHDCLAETSEAAVELASLGTDPAVFVSLNNDDDNGRQREYTRKSSTPNNDHYRSSGTGYDDRRRPYGC